MWALRNVVAFLFGVLLATDCVHIAFGQSVPNGGISTNLTWTVPQWIAAWQSKADVTGGVLYNPTINGPTFAQGATLSGGSLNGTNAATYGWGNNAVGCSFVTNSIHTAQVMGTFGVPSAMTGYSERDSVGCYFDNTAPPLVAAASGTFTATTFTPTVALSPAVVAQLKVGMLIDTSDSPKFTGQIISWTNSGTSITVSNWYQFTGTNGGPAGTPSGSIAYIGPVTKAFGGNIVCLLNSLSYATSCAGIEVDIQDLSSTAATNTTWAYDCNNTNGTTVRARDCYMARGYFDYGFQANTTGVAGFFVPVTANVLAGYLYQGASGVAFEAGAVMSSGFYFLSSKFNVAYTGQTDIGDKNSPSTAPIVLHNSGNAGGDASIVSSGGTGLSDGAVSIGATGGLILNGALKMTPVLVGALPTCNTASKGFINEVSDANSPTYNSTLSGGGSSYAFAICNGTNWTAH
jgi:hypothetical protein